MQLEASKVSKGGGGFFTWAIRIAVPHDTRMPWGDMALFQAWCGFLGLYLVAPAMMAAAMEGIIAYRGYTHTAAHTDHPLQILNLLVAIGKACCRQG